MAHPSCFVTLRYQDANCLMDGFGLIIFASMLIYVGILVPCCIYTYQRCVRGRFGSSYSLSSVEAGLTQKGMVQQNIFIINPSDNFGVQYKKRAESDQEEQSAGSPEEHVLRVLSMPAYRSLGQSSL